MVDSNDRERIQEAAEELQKMVTFNQNVNILHSSCQLHPARLDGHVLAPHIQFIPPSIVHLFCHLVVIIHNKDQTTIFFLLAICYYIQSQ